MSHLIEEYAKTLGVKIGNPHLVDHFFPTLHERYVTIHSNNKIDSKYYEYFPQVLDLVRDTLHKNGIAIYQVGQSEDPRLNVDGLFLNATHKQSFNLIKKSLLHIDVDGLYVHIANTFNTPIIALYSNVHANHSRPYWNTENVTIFESEKNGNKPSYALQENPKTIRSINPELIGQAIFDKLQIKARITFKTKKIGSIYHVPILEIVPNFVANLKDNDKMVYLRADLHFDLQKIAFWSQTNQCTIMTDREIDLNLINQFKDNIKQVFFKIKNTDISAIYFEQLKRLKINFVICVDDQSILDSIRNFYFDFKIDFDDWKSKAEKFEKNNCNFLTSKTILSNEKVYASEAHLKLGIQLDSSNNVLYDDLTFWKESEHFLFYERI